MGVLTYGLILVVSVNIIYAAKLNADSDAKKKGCSQPEAVKNGQFYHTSPTTIEYRCRPDYILLGSDTRECQEDGEWTGTVPICIGTRCPFPGYLDKGTAIVSYDGGYVTFECEKGYKLKGRDKIVCEGDKWDAPMPECIERGGSRKKNGNEAELDDHYALLTKSDYTCITEGKKVVPPEYENTYMDINYALFDRQARLYAVYRCVWGFVPKSEPRVTRYCQNGKWVGDEPFCTPASETEESYYSKDSPRSGSRHWSHKDWIRNSDYSCMKKKGVKAPAVYNAKTTARVEILEGYPRLYVEYTCQSGFRFADKAKFMYCDDGKWVGDLPHCQKSRSNKNNGLYLRVEE